MALTQLDAGAGYSTFIFTAHMQHGTSGASCALGGQRSGACSRLWLTRGNWPARLCTAADVTARTAQMVQAADFISAQTAAVATGTGSDS